MAVMQQAVNAQCMRCGQQYYDPHGSIPCPQCGEMVDIGSLGKPAQRQQAEPQSKVASAPKSAQPQGGARPGLLIGVFAFLFGAIPWLEGARTTRDGWVIALNWILDRLHIPAQIPASTLWPWWGAVCALFVLGIGYSVVELRFAPMRIPASSQILNANAWRINHSWQAWIVWLVIIITDVGTMYLGARQARPDDPAILRQIAESGQAAAIYAIIITFVPDRLARWGWKTARG